MPKLPTSTPTILDLSNRAPREAHAVNEGGFVQRVALALFRELVHVQLHNLPPLAPFDGRQNGAFTRVHNAILVDGARGTGTTTFLLTVQELVLSRALFPDDPDFALRCGIVDLGIIDPTLIEAKEHLFVTLIARIKRLVDEYHDQGGRARRSQEMVGADRDYAAWEQSLLDLAGGLTLLSGSGGSNELAKDAWEDPTFVLQQGLRNAKHGGDLERRFHAFVDHSLKYLGKQAFFLAFDDVDTDFAQGFPVLDTVRRYLTTPRLIIVMSGDFTLYSSMVRKRQWENLGALPTVYESRERYEPLVDQLEEQFLLKVLKPENRITLRPLRDLYKGIRVTKDPAAEAMDIEHVYGNLLNDVFAVQSWTELVRFLYVFLEQPLRTNMQVLRAFDDATGPDWRLPVAGDERRQDFLAALASVFASSLTLRGFPPASLKHPSYGELAIYLASRNLLQNAYRLRPEFRDERLNVFLMVLSAFFTEDMRSNPAGYLDYFIKVCLPREVLVSSAKETKSVTEASFKESYLDFVGSDMNEDAIQTARKHSAYFPADAAHPGVVPTRAGSARRRPAPALNAWLYGDENPAGLRDERVSPMIQKFKHTVETMSAVTGDKRYVHTPESLEAAISSWQRSLVTILFSNNIDQSRKAIPKASIFNLLGFLSVVLNAVNIADVKQKLAIYAQIRDFPTYFGQRSTPSRGAEPEGDREDAWRDAEYGQVPDSFLQALYDWKLLGQRCDPLPVYVVAKIWTRFYYTLGSIDQELAKDEAYLGYMVHRYIVAFLNAALVETMLHYGLTPTEIRNPVSSDRYFVRNLRTLEERPSTETSQIDFFSFLLACPVWRFYLMPDNDPDSVFTIHRNIMTRFIRSNDDAWLPTTFYGMEAPEHRFRNLFDPLNSIMLAHVDRTPRRETTKTPPRSGLPQQLSSAIQRKNAFRTLVRKHRDALRDFLQSHPEDNAGMEQAINNILNLRTGGVDSKSFRDAAGIILEELNW